MNWNVLLIGGASGIGKTSIVNKLSEIYKVKIIEVDDIFQTVEAVTTKEEYPAIHFWSNGTDWTDIGVSGNVQWLSDVSKELEGALRAIVQNHLEDEVPVIIEGDFISPEFSASFGDKRVKSVFLYESDEKQIIENYLNREGGDPQKFRAQISAEYSRKLKNDCLKYNVSWVDARPWNSLAERTIEKLV